MSKSYLFLFHLGPVQSFIAQARKTQDLYAGSQLLGNLMHLALGCAKVQGHEIIFPYFDANGCNTNLEANQEAYPNHFLARLNMEQERVQKFGEALENLLHEQLCKTALEKFKPVMPESDAKACAEQINRVLVNLILHTCAHARALGAQTNLNSNGFLEIYWVAMEEGENYGECYKQLEQRLGALKQARQWEHLLETGRKCSVNGQYNVKVYRKTKDEQTKPLEAIRKNKLFAEKNFIVNNKDRHIKLRHLQLGEGLCAISFLKRLYKDDLKNPFPSTAAIALLHLYKNAEIRQLIEAFESMVEDGYDEQLLYEENLNERYIERYGVVIKNGYDLTSLQDQQEKIKKVGPKLSKHYALLRFDGDNMGQWLSKAPDSDKQREFSKILRDFSNKIKDYVDEPEQHRGRTIYAGGDDFLALVNLSALFDVLKKIQCEFKTVRPKIPIPNGTATFSISTSVLIAHYKTPLQKVVNYSDELLKKTKTTLQDADKDGLGMAFMKKTGFIGELIVKNRQLDLLTRLFGAIQSEQMNSRFIYRFAETFGAWRNEENRYEHFSEWETQTQLVRTEFRRLMLKEVKKEYKTQMEALCEDMLSALLDTNHHRQTIQLEPLLQAVRIVEALNAEI